VHPRDHRLAEFPHVPEQIRKQTAAVVGRRRVVGDATAAEVGARAERLVTRARKHDNVYGVVRSGPCECVPQPLHDTERHRVTALRSVDRDPSDTLLDVVQHLIDCHDCGSYSRTIDAVLVLAIAVVVALIIPLLTRGSYVRLLNVQWYWPALLFIGLAIQIALEYVTIPKEHWHDYGFGLLVASYVLILGFACRNFVIRGMGIVIIGILCNALVIALNQGMPVKIPPQWRNEKWAQATVKHHPQQHDDKLRFLSDIIVLKDPYNVVLSFGDLIIAVGLCDVAYNASRRAKKRRTLHVDLSEPLEPPVPLAATATTLH